MERTKLLHDRAAALGISWARSLSETTLRERGVVAGGFPGTIPEARWRVASDLGAELVRLALSPLLPNEASSAVQATYARARREWLQLARGGERPREQGSTGLRDRRARRDTSLDTESR